VSTSGQSRDLFEGGLGILAVTPISGPTAPDAALIQGLFDLTPAEAKVARGIAQGLTVDEMAARYGTARETVRTQVKTLLGKTGARRQVEVAARLSALPKMKSRNDCVAGRRG
jgi:DNA-binding CsgD family transcriptional regulator